MVTGVHGASHAGLQLLLNPEVGQNLTPAQKTALIAAHQRPQPRLDVLPLLSAIFTFPRQIPIAGMDSSDGLADAVLQICRASGVGAVLDGEQIPLPPAFTNWLTPEQALEYALYGGEDFELVLCLPPALAKNLIQMLDNNTAIIGTIKSHPQVILKHQDEKIPDRVLTLSQGFQHFSQ